MKSAQIKSIVCEFSLTGHTCVTNIQTKIQNVLLVPQKTSCTVTTNYPNNSLDLDLNIID